MFTRKKNLWKRRKGLSYRELSNKFQISIGAVSNILKRKLEYTNDYESKRNKILKRKFKNEFNQDANTYVYERFTLQRSKNILEYFKYVTKQFKMFTFKYFFFVVYEVDKCDQ